MTGVIDSPEIEIALAEMIEALRRELETAQVQGSGRAVAFGVDKVDLELKVVVSRKAKGEGGIKFWVVSAGATAEGSREMAHTFKVTLSPLDARSKQRLQVASTSDTPVSRDE